MGSTLMFGWHCCFIGSSGKGDHPSTWKHLDPRKTFGPGRTQKVGHPISSPRLVQPMPYLPVSPLSRSRLQTF